MRISDWSSDVCSSDLLVDIGFHGAIVALCDVEHLGEEALDFLIQGNAIRIGVIGDGQFVITIAVFYHGVVAFQHRLNPLPSGFSTSSTLVEVLDNQMQDDAGSGQMGSACCGGGGWHSGYISGCA